MKVLAILSLFVATRLPAGEITVFAAASLAEAFTAIGGEYEKTSDGVRAVLSPGASNQLRNQIEQGAKADVFASANMKEMDALVKAGLVDAAKVKIFARNRLVVIVPKDNPGKIETLKDLGRPKLKVVIAAPAVPVGKYTLEMLDKAAALAGYGKDFKNSVLANIVSEEENVKAVVAKIRLGAADAGIAYVSDVTEKAAKEISSIAIADEINPLAVYPIAVLKNAPSAAAAEQYVRLVLSEKGQALLQQHGFLPVEEPRRDGK